MEMTIRFLTYLLGTFKVRIHTYYTNYKYLHQYYFVLFDILKTCGFESYVV